MGKICVFFGHRLILNPELVEQQLTNTVRTLIQEGVDTFWLGGYGDFDKIAAKVTRNQQKEFPHIKRVLVLAYLPTNKEDYQFKKSFYEEMFYPEGVELVPKKFAITKRNKYMVEQADVVIGCTKEETGGAEQALKYAKKLNKKIILIR